MIAPASLLSIERRYRVLLNSQVERCRRFRQSILRPHTTLVWFQDSSPPRRLIKILKDNQLGAIGLETQMKVIHQGLVSIDKALTRGCLQNITRRKRSWLTRGVSYQTKSRQTCQDQVWVQSQTHIVVCQEVRLSRNTWLTSRRRWKSLTLRSRQLSRWASISSLWKLVSIHSKDWLMPKTTYMWRSRCLRTCLSVILRKTL